MIARRTKPTLKRGVTALVTTIAAFTASTVITTTAHAQVDQAVALVQAGNMAAARNLFSSRSMPGHFGAMNADRRGGVSLQEMDTYFVAMHRAFDRDRNGIVSVPEAPQILLRYRLSGKPFPPQGLTQAELRNRLRNLFVKVDRNRDGGLSWLEMLR